MPPRGCTGTGSHMRFWSLDLQIGALKGEKTNPLPVGFVIHIMDLDPV